MAAFLCCSASFSHLDDGDPCSPRGRGCRRRYGGCRDNPYSTRGLEKFSTVLAELEARREKIMAAAPSSQPGVYIIRFVYSSSDEWVPVIVKTHEQPSPAEKSRKGRCGGEVQKKKQAAGTAAAGLYPGAAGRGVGTAAVDAREVRKSLSWKAGEGESGGGGDGGLWSSFVCRPSWYVSMAAVLILFCMALNGRAFAICCASLWWYAVPTMVGGGGHGVRRPVKEHGKKMSNRRLGAAAAAAASAAARRAGGGSDGFVARRSH